MIRLTFSSLVTVAMLLVLSSTSQAQIFVPHTTTHIDLVPHRGHYDAVPHTTTHYHILPAPSYGSFYGSGQGMGLGYNTGFGSSYRYNTGHNSYFAPRCNTYPQPRPVYHGGYRVNNHFGNTPHPGHHHH